MSLVFGVSLETQVFGLTTFLIFRFKIVSFGATAF